MLKSAIRARGIQRYLTESKLEIRRRLVRFSDWFQGMCFLFVRLTCSVLHEIIMGDEPQILQWPVNKDSLANDGIQLQIPPTLRIVGIIAVVAQNK